MSTTSQQPYISASGHKHPLSQSAPAQPAQDSLAGPEDVLARPSSSATPTLFQPQPQYYIPGQGARLAAGFMPGYSAALPSTGLASSAPYPAFASGPAASYAQAYGMPGEHRLILDSGSAAQGFSAPTAQLVKNLQSHE